MPDYRKVEADYTAEDLQHLSDLEHVRERPSMYIGDTTLRGLHHLVYEVVDNSIDEAMAEDAVHQISVVINNDGSVTVEDGRRIPVETHQDLGFSTLQGVKVTVLKPGGNSARGAYSDLRRVARRRRDGRQFSVRVVRGRSAPRRPRISTRI